MDFTRLCLLLFLVSTYAADFFTPCDGRSVHRRRTTKKLQLAKYWDVIGQKISHVDGSTTSQPYISSPFTLPPFDSLPNNAPPYCSYPQTTPMPSSSPPPPYNYVPSPPVYEPPVIYPPPSAPPPPQPAANIALWCVAKASVPDPIIREAMIYACGTVADCDSILPNGPCFLPNTLLAHASYAFNSYWQKTKVGGGAATCQFGGTAMLVTVDPRRQSCCICPTYEWTNAGTIRASVEGRILQLAASDMEHKPKERTGSLGHVYKDECTENDMLGSMKVTIFLILANCHLFIHFLD